MLLAELQLEKEEVEIYQFLNEKYHELQEMYLSVVPKARKMIMERLVNAFLREGFFKDLNIEGQLKSHKVEIPLAKGTLVFPVAVKYSFNRYLVRGDIIFIDYSQIVTEIVHPLVLLNIVKEELDAKEMKYENTQSFQRELANSVANMGLVLLFQHTRFEFLQHPNLHDFRNIIELADYLRNADPLFDSSLFFEQLCVSGHQLHPCTKAKSHLQIEEVIQYSTEFANSVPLSFVAVHEQSSYHNPKLTKENIHTFWRREYPAVYEQFLDSCRQLNQNYDAYFLIPIHPWQKEHVLSSLYKKELESGDVFIVDGCTLETKPTLSVRTVSPFTTEEKKFHIKLPLNIQMTSAVRTISANSVHNGPELSIILKDILKREEFSDGNFHVIGEEIGVRFDAKDNKDDAAGTKSKNLSYLMRRNPASLSEDGEHAIVACALFNLSPVTNKLLVYEMIEAYHLLHPSNSLEETMFLFFRKYVRVLLDGVIPMMSRYGIGLEAHLQNTVIVLKDFEPVKVVVRDLGGVRVDKRRLEKQGFHGTYYPGSVTVGEDEAAMQNKVIHTVFQSQIGELTFQLAKEYGIEEQVLWNIVRDICDTIFLELKQDNAIAENIESDMAALFAPTVQTKALTLMRLKGDVTDYAFIDVDNPLC